MNTEKGPRLIELPRLGNTEIGFLHILDGWDALPFVPQRVYWTTGVPEGVLRGHHAHKTLWQLIVAVSGSLEFEIENPRGLTDLFLLDQPDVGLIVPPKHWRTIRFSPNSVLLCLASAPYQVSDYIRDYAEFKTLEWG